ALQEPGPCVLLMDTPLVVAHVGALPFFVCRKLNQWGAHAPDGNLISRGTDYSPSQVRCARDAAGGRARTPSRFKLAPREAFERGSRRPASRAVERRVVP